MTRTPEQDRVYQAEYRKRPEVIQRKQQYRRLRWAAHPTSDPKQPVYRESHRLRSYEIVKMAKSVPCADCGISYPPYVMDFDHRGSVKLFSIGESRARVSVQRLLDEIAKCDVVCANCHRERTHGSSDFG